MPETTRVHLRMRVRVRFADDPRPVLVLTDTPRPSCPLCLGNGGWNEYVSDGGSPEDGETWFLPCDCWSSWHRRLFRIPVWLAQRFGWLAPGGYSDEPPF
jgi:hypothetical protein